jgi:hypothetical protein
MRTILCRVPRSHRKLAKLITALGYQPTFYYSFRFGGNFIYVLDEEWEKVAGLVSRARVDETKLLRCWNGV